MFSYLRNFKIVSTKMAYFSKYVSLQQCCKKKKMHVDGEGKIHDSKKWNFGIFMTKVVNTTKTTLWIDCSLKQILEQPHLKDSQLKHFI